MKNETNLGFADAVAKAQGSVVRVGGRCGGGASGIVLADGEVVTSAHALGDAEEVTVSLGETRTKATLVGRDEVSDVALLKLEDASLGTPLKIAKTDALRVGDAVVALGRPGKSIRASARIIGVLADAFALSGGLTLDHYVESDRRLPRGFGGGPLVNAQGEAIGMNSRAVVRGADLCLPFVTLDKVLAELRQHGGRGNGYLGVRVQTVRLPDALREGHEIAQRRGAMVTGIAEDSPAARGGLVLGDTIIGIESQTVYGPRALRAALQRRADQAIDIALIRAGDKAAITLTAGARA